MPLAQTLGDRSNRFGDVAWLLSRLWKTHEFGGGVVTIESLPVKGAVIVVVVCNPDDPSSVLDPLTIGVAGDCGLGVSSIDD